MEMWTKEDIRTQVAAARWQLGQNKKEEEERNHRLFEKVRRQTVFCEAGEIYLYASYNHEVGTMELARVWLEEGRHLAFPKVKGKKMEFYWVDSLEDLETGYMGILEPKAGCRRAESIFAPVLVPGIAFDWRGGRVGYGGGYYDRFFEQEKDHKKIGYAFLFQMYDTVPTQEHDVRMDMVVTEDLEDSM